MEKTEKVWIRTRLGDIKLGFRPDLAPNHVENFLELARSGFYDDCLFHRVIPGFMVQGGDPNSKLPDRRLHGTGGAENTLKAEFSAEPHRRGAVSMARASDPDSASSQFFLVVDDSPHLDNQYTYFGTVEEGLDVLDAICREETDPRDNPVEPVSMKMEVVEG